MGRIHTLDEHLTNMIAAGEVVERPAGVIKELVENAIDAGSSAITVKVSNGGCSSIEVIDDGCGMDPVDATMAFQRHATSKISRTNDLWEIRTMGFRGEALPSIASVSKVDLKTCDGNTSTEVKIEYGKIVSAGPCAANNGTSIKVEGLFYRTPARLKHLKSGNIELNYILEIMQKFALSHPEIAFELYSDEKLRFQTNGSGVLGEAILAVYGLEVAKNTVDIAFEDGDFKVTGIIVMPSCSRATKQYIGCFINGRMIRSGFINKAVCEAYSGYTMPDRYPIVVLNITTDFKLVDVNVHPSKWEIRLSKEKQLCELIKNSIRQILHDHLKPGDIRLEVKPVKVKIEEVPLFTETYSSDFKTVETPYIAPVEKKTEMPKLVFHEEIFESEVKMEEQKAEYVSNPQSVVANTAPVIDRFTFLAQLHGNYILACDSENLYIVDQHAAMERCMYEKICRQIELKQTDTQPLLVPLVIELAPSQLNQLDKINNVLAMISMEAEAFSNNSIVIREVPVWFDSLNETQFIHDLIDATLADKQMSALEIQKDRIATTACHSSIRFNHYLSEMECRALLKELGSCLQPFNCPHGRPTMMIISEKQLEKEFKRV